MKLAFTASLIVVSLAPVVFSPNAFCDTSAAVNSVVTYEVRGVLKSYDLPSRQAVVSHEEIPGYMQAMTMSFEVKDAAELRELHPGDKLNFLLYVTAERAWIERLRKTGVQPISLEVPAHAKNNLELGVGDLFPDTELVNQFGQKLHLSDFRGHVVALTFIYTRCPLPTYCPLMSRNFQLAQPLLARLVPGDSARFVSLSLDSQYDTPEVLGDYAKNYQADAHQWIFAAGQDENVRSLGESVGLEFTRDSSGRIDHNLRTIVIDAAGRLRNIFRGNAWTPQELASAMRAAMKPKIAGRN